MQKNHVWVKIVQLVNELVPKKQKMVLTKNAKMCSKHALYIKNMRRV